MSYLYTAEYLTEDPRVAVRRRLQQRRCLVCGARNLVNHQTSYFCATHKPDWRFCSACETLRPKVAHGKSWLCNGCASTKATAQYHANPDRCLYRLRLKQLARRTQTRGDQIFEHMRRRIALADLVRATPQLSWPKRAALLGRNANQLACDYRMQCAGRILDMDRPDAGRRRRTR